MANVMDNSPCVQSLGKRCMQGGFSFVWNAGTGAVLVAPNGRRHTLDIQHLVRVMPVRGQTELAEMHATSDSTKGHQETKPSDEVSIKNEIPKDHCFTHFPKLSTCDVCQQAKTQKATCRRKKRTSETTSGKNEAESVEM